MIGKGVFEVDVEGKVIGFKFGPFAGAMTEREAGGTPMSEVFERMTKGSIEMTLYYFYGAHIAYCKTKSINPDDIVTFGDTIEAIGIEKLTEIYNSSLGVYPKNDPAPQTEGQKPSE